MSGKKGAKLGIERHGSLTGNCPSLQQAPWSLSPDVLFYPAGMWWEEKGRGLCKWLWRSWRMWWECKWLASEKIRGAAVPIIDSSVWNQTMGVILSGPPPALSPHSSMGVATQWGLQMRGAPFSTRFCSVILRQGPVSRWMKVFIFLKCNCLL